MSLFQTSSSLTTVNSTDNYITFTPCHLNPSIIDHKAEIYKKNREQYEKPSNNNSYQFLDLNNSLDAYYQNSSNKINKRLFDFKFKDLNKKYTQENYEYSLVKKLFASKNDSEALHVMSKLWKGVKFCDLIIVIGGVQYLAHRVILALYSQKYRNFFHEQKYDFVTRIVLKESRPKALQQILRFLYLKEEIRFNIRSIDSLLTCIKELGLNGLQETCEKMLYQFDKKFVFELIEISSKHRIKQLYAEAFLYVCLNFNESIKYSSFLNSSFRNLIEILEHNAIRDRDETLLFKRIVDWIEKNKEFIYKHPESVVKLLKNINFSKIHPHVIKNLKSENGFLFQMFNCDYIINEALRSLQNNAKSNDGKYIRERTLSVEIPRRISKKKDSRFAFDENISIEKNRL